jgi:Pyruvate/2-oxoacid:ferredoxin oxidoreductase delta subunit
MGHMTAKDIYRELGRKIDGLTVRVPWNETLHAMLRALYSTEEADLVVRMPFGLATLPKVAEASGLPNAEVRRLLESLCDKGLVMDIWLRGEYHYTISPLIIGIFELTMMRTGANLPTREWAELFHDYLQAPGTFYAANFGHGERVSVVRTLPHEEALGTSEHVEVLDYEKAAAIVSEAKSFAIGLCSCRHEKLHAGLKSCDIPLETCSTLGSGTEYMVRRGFAREVSQSEMQDNLARSREIGLVLMADNVRRDVSFICHCCPCCCNVLLGVSKFGYPNTVVTSTFMARRDAGICSECGTCAEACPIDAITFNDEIVSHVDESVCLGCGVCAVKCPSGAMTLVKRKQRVLHPENTIERVVLQCLERGTLQNLLFPDPNNTTQAFMRAFVGAFLRLAPVKRALMGDTLRSRFLASIQRNA